MERAGKDMKTKPDAGSEAGSWQGQTSAEWKMVWNLAFAASKRLVKIVVKNSGHFRASLLEERGAAKIHQKFHGIFEGDFHTRFQERISHQHFCKACRDESCPPSPKYRGTRFVMQSILPDLGSRNIFAKLFSVDELKRVLWEHCSRDGVQRSHHREARQRAWIWRVLLGPKWLHAAKLFWAINLWITSHYRTSVIVCPD